ncbi:protein secretion protein [Gracilibacillus oryzae]|uniref:peptidylprolyl isomerase n=1 Tax=Gracilibacillus oryzae TaxID=1672701 RepID=A0A7C8GQG5_9BACI|nr:peptidyl-prolyl cis-trans isomerase [Gracilibacillus oryzae]KAB8126412.1 protein secretion protein [Gracilibacillus oryzae]
MSLSKLSLWIVIFLLLITNIFTLFFYKDEEKIEDQIVFKTEAGPLATINGEEINRNDVSQRLMDQYGEQTLIDLVNEKVVFSLAEKNNLVIEDKIMERELSRLLVMQGLVAKQEMDQLKKDWKRQIEYRYYLQQLLTKDMEISDSEVKQYYDTYKRQYNFEQRIQLSHIVTPSLEKAEEVLAELNSGESFAAAAKEYSIDESSVDGGYLGFYSETSSFIPPEYFQQATQLESGSFSNAFETSQGIAIIFVHQILPSITFTYEEAFHEVKQDLALEQLDQSINATTLWDEAEVKTILDSQ